MNSNSNERKQYLSSLFKQWLDNNPNTDLFSSEEVLGPNPPRSDKHLLSHVLKERGYCLHLSPIGKVWSNRAHSKWVNPRREELELKLNEYLLTDNPEEITTHEFLERFYPQNVLTNRSDKNLMARILEDKGWLRKVEAMPLVKRTRSKMARVWVRPRESKRKPRRLLNKDGIE